MSTTYVDDDELNKLYGAFPRWEEVSYASTAVSVGKTGLGTLPTLPREMTIPAALISISVAERSVKGMAGEKVEALRNEVREVRRRVESLRTGAPPGAAPAPGDPSMDDIRRWFGELVGRNDLSLVGAEMIEMRETQEAIRLQGFEFITDFVSVVKLLLKKFVADKPRLEALENMMKGILTRREDNPLSGDIDDFKEQLEEFDGTAEHFESVVASAEIMYEAAFTPKKIGDEVINPEQLNDLMTWVQDQKALPRAPSAEDAILADAARDAMKTMGIASVSAFSSKIQTLQGAETREKALADTLSEMLFKTGLGPRKTGAELVGQLEQLRIRFNNLRDRMQKSEQTTWKIFQAAFPGEAIPDTVITSDQLERLLVWARAARVKAELPPGVEIVSPTLSQEISSLLGNATHLQTINEHQRLVEELLSSVGIGTLASKHNTLEWTKIMDPTFLTAEELKAGRDPASAFRYPGLASPLTEMVTSASNVDPSEVTYWIPVVLQDLVSSAVLHVWKAGRLPGLQSNLRRSIQDALWGAVRAYQAVFQVLRVNLLDAGATKRIKTPVPTEIPEEGWKSSEVFTRAFYGHLVVPILARGFLLHFTAIQFLFPEWKKLSFLSKNFPATDAVIETPMQNVDVADQVLRTKPEDPSDVAYQATLMAKLDNLSNNKTWQEASKRLDNAFGGDLNSLYTNVTLKEVGNNPEWKLEWTGPEKNILDVSLTKRGDAKILHEVLLSVAVRGNTIARTLIVWQSNAPADPLMPSAVVVHFSSETLPLLRLVPSSKEMDDSARWNIGPTTVFVSDFDADLSRTVGRGFNYHYGLVQLPVSWEEGLEYSIGLTIFSDFRTLDRKGTYLYWSDTKTKTYTR